MNVRNLSLLVLLAGVGGGCAHLSLKDKLVRDISVRPEDASLCPGQETRLAVVATMGAGPELATTGAGHGKVGWDNYHVTVNGDTASDGKIRLPSDARVTWNKPATLVVIAPDHPGVQWKGEIAARYDCKFQGTFSADAGSDGTSGNNGVDGDAPDGEGGKGKDGWQGASGDDAPSVEAWVTTVVGPGQASLVQARVESMGDDRYYAFDPAQGRLTIYVRGGAGGVGGAGGDGGDGGKGSKDDKRGRGGDGGDGAVGREGGNGGDVRLHVDPRARPYMDRVSIENGGGAGGEGGAGGSGGSGAPRGRGGKRGSSGRDGHDGHLETEYETVKPLW